MVTGQKHVEARNQIGARFWNMQESVLNHLNDRCYVSLDKALDDFRKTSIRTEIIPAAGDYC
ncbi:hypothetical protein CS542_02355 [Pedobacter sp. IW39]|nr:hypothetical protein CS542_02355 [Pedobacter sp. IW39]